ncbi:hypothetical protein [Hydrogenophaga sp.]|uniref:hypothetical protein n=1 Tax=Hydrogenophaga sp. TaxID=1904254 RepID=UPI0019892F42|nr:hypothetical protein [Hydrogenophaga sp.]MBD3892393.1 hypothetical protein [Hydrogenophaga sp.]
MDFYLVWIVLIAAAYAVKTVEQRQRIALLGSFLHPYQLEQLMQDLSSGYLRAMGEADPQRRAAIWHTLESSEQTLREQLQGLAADLRRLSEPQARVSRLPLALPLINRLVAGQSFDLRAAVAIHAKSFSDILDNHQCMSRKDQSFMLLAELMLFQHTCHWFCRSQLVASARLQVRHKTAYEQVLAAVSAPTRQAYNALLRRAG